MVDVVAIPRKKAPSPASSAGSGITLGRVLGIECRVSPSLLVIAALMVSSLAAQFLSSHPDDPAWAVAVALVAGALFFASILAHELAHSVLARRRGVDVQDITLFIFGGVSRLKGEPRGAVDEFVIALVGPLASAVIGGACLALGTLLPEGGMPTEAVNWLGWVNLQLAAFNLLPGYPLDGGRVLRAAVWGFTGDLRKATRWAAAGGMAVAHGLIMGGVVLIFAFHRLEGIWLGLIGMFLLSAVHGSLAQAHLKDLLERSRVEALLTREVPILASTERLDEVVSRLVLAGGREVFAVAEDGDVLGLLTSDLILRVPAARRPWMSAAEAMLPLKSSPALTSGSTLHDAFVAMESAGSAWLPVVDDGRFAGVVGRDDILRFARLQTRFGADRGPN